MAAESHFLADVHLPLSPGPRTNRFLRYLRSCDPREVDQVFLLGDLFHYWIPSSTLVREAYAEVLAEIRRAGRRGVRFHFCPGNRDFLFGSGSDPELRKFIVFHPEGTVVELGPRRAYVSHGDDLCVADWGYRAWKRFARSAPALFLFHRLPERWREWMVNRLSRASREMAGGKTVAVPERVYDEIFRRGVDVVIHGHLHPSGSVCVKGRTGETRVLPSWDAEPCVLVYDSEGDRFDLRSLGDPLSPDSRE